MKKIIFTAMAALLLVGCGGKKNALTTPAIDTFDYTVEQFADMQILRYRVPDVEKLSLRQQEMLYYLNEAALQGRDIMFDQNCKYNLPIRQVLEAIYTDENQDKTSADFMALEIYLNVFGVRTVFIITMPVINLHPNFRKFFSKMPCVNCLTKNCR